jgi:hypothetical protein
MIMANGKWVMNDNEECMQTSIERNDTLEKSIIQPSENKWFDE